MPDIIKKLKEYDSEPVICCSKCYSLKIKYEESSGTDYCLDCGSTDVEEMSIDKWESLYEKRHGKKYIEDKKDIRRSPIFNMTMRQLKDRVYDSPEYKKIIYGLYRNFPKGLSKADSVLLLFDKAYKDHKIDDLKILIIKYT